MLTAHGQDADVYHHILFTAGNALLGTPAADVENSVFRAWDWKQANLDGRQESLAEVADDDAGMAVGRLMYDAAMAGQRANYWGLKTDIMNILCGP